MTSDAADDKVVIIYADAGAGSKMVAGHLQRVFDTYRCVTTTVSLNEIIPTTVCQFLFGRYRHWCAQDQTALNRFYRSRLLYPLLYGAVLPLKMRRYKVRDAERIRRLFAGCKQVVATSFLAAFFACYYNRLYGLGLEISGVCCDYGTSAGWRIASLRRLIVSHDRPEPVLAYLRKNGVEIATFGIPADPGSNAFSGHGARRTGAVMLAGGGWGLGRAFDFAASILADSRVQRLLIVCGDNRAVYASLHRKLWPEIQNGRVALHGCVDDMGDLYRQVDVVVTKAGGVSLTEALLRGVIPIICCALFCHEEENRRFMLSRHAALSVGTDEELRHALNLILSDEGFADRLLANGRALVNPLAAHQTAVSLALITKESNHVDQ